MRLSTNEVELSTVSDIERETLRRVSVRLLPFLFVLYLLNFLDRSNVALAALQMNRDLKFSSSAFGFGAGIFFAGYAIFEVPSNIALARIGARRWIARIMISWGLIATAMMFVRTPMSFYVLRFLLGVAEAGFFPGIVWYLTQWFPKERRARATTRFFLALPMSGLLGGTLGAYLLSLDGKGGIAGWQWLFLMEGIPSIVFGIACLFYLTDSPAKARWLSGEQREWLIQRMEQDVIAANTKHDMPALHALRKPVIWFLAIPYFCMLTAGYAYTFWSPIVIREALHLSDTKTSLVVAAIALCSMTFMLLHAHSSDKRHERFLHAALGGVLIAIGFGGAALISNPVLRVMFFGLVIVGSNSLLAPFWCLPSMVLSGSSAAVGIALINSLGNVGGFLGPYLIGFLKDMTGGTRGSFLVLSGFGAACAFFVVVLRQTAFGVSARQRVATT